MNNNMHLFLSADEVMCVSALRSKHYRSSQPVVTLPVKTSQLTCQISELYFDQAHPRNLTSYEIACFI